MKLSVIVPAYNAEKTIRESLDSILHQTRPVDELIVVNDGSSDGTERILQEYRDAYPACFRFRTVENGGQGRARNIGFDALTSPPVTGSATWTVTTGSILRCTSA